MVKFEGISIIRIILFFSVLAHKVTNFFLIIFQIIKINLEVSDIFHTFATDKKQSSTVFPLVSPSIQSAGGEVPGTATIREDNSDGSGVFQTPRHKSLGVFEL